MYSKLGGVTVPKVGQETIVSDNPEVYQGTEDNLHNKVSYDNPIPGIRHLRYGDVLPTKPQKLGWDSHLSTNTTVSVLR